MVTAVLYCHLLLLFLTLRPERVLIAASCFMPSLRYAGQDERRGEEEPGASEKNAVATGDASSGIIPIPSIKQEGRLMMMLLLQCSGTLFNDDVL